MSRAKGTIEYQDYSLSYKEIRGGIELVSISFTKPVSILELPSKINDGDVISIGDKFLYKGPDKLTDIVLPEGIKSVGSSSFKQLEDLEYIEFPKSIEVICNNAFESCHSLKEVKFNEPSNLKKIEKSAFKSCKKLKHIKLPEGLVKLEEMSFFGCTDRTSGLSIEVPKSLTDIDSNALLAFHEYDDEPNYKQIRVLADHDTLIGGKYANRECELIPIANDTVKYEGNTYVIDKYGALLQQYDNKGKDVINIPDYIIYNGKQVNVYGILTKAIYMSLIDVSEIKLPSHLEYVAYYGIVFGKTTKPVILPPTLRRIEKYAFCFGSAFIYIDNDDEDFNLPFGEGKDTIVVTNNKVKDTSRYVVEGIDIKDVVLCDDYYFVIKNNKAGIIKYLKDSDFVIPNEITVNNKTYPVTAIFPYAFSYCKNVNKMVVPDNVECIYDCSGPYGTDGLKVEVGENSHLRLLEWIYGSGQAIVFNRLPPRLEYFPHRMYSNRFSFRKEEVANLKHLKVALESSLGFNGWNDIVLPSSVKFIDKAFDKDVRKISFIDGADPDYFDISNILYNYDERDRAKNIEFNEYDGGLYLGSPSNPYLVLVLYNNIASPIINIHPETRVIAPKALFYAGNAHEIILPKKLKALWSELMDWYFVIPVVKEWPENLEFITPKFVSNIDTKRSAPVPKNLTMLDPYHYLFTELMAKKPRWDD